MYEKFKKQFNYQDDSHLDCRIIYVGDPMCSWCWGMAPSLQALNAHAQKNNIPFHILVGGLRLDGGDEWTASFRQFLREHWQEVARRSGQPFSYDLLNLTYFDYRTKEACLAVVIAKQLLEEQGKINELYPFFHAIQKQFYVDNQDPKQLAFYRPICQEYSLNFAEFSHLWHSDTSKNNLHQDLIQARKLKANAFPSVFFEIKGKIQPLSIGFKNTIDLCHSFNQIIELSGLNSIIQTFRQPE